MPLPFLLVDSLLQNEQYRSKLQKSNERSLALVKSAVDIVVAVGLLQLAPKKVTPRVTGAFGFASSVISCYQVYTSLLNNSSCLPLYIYHTASLIITYQRSLRDHFLAQKL